jgi:hypothetical protein
MAGPLISGNDGYYPLKKSGTQHEKNELDQKMGLTPLRHKKNNVIMAYNIQTTNTMGAHYGNNLLAGPYNPHGEF